MKKANIADFNSSVPATSKINVVWSDRTMGTKSFVVTNEGMQTKESLNKLQITCVVSSKET